VDEGAGGDEDLFGETAITLDTEELAMEADGFFALEAEFALAAEDVGLDGDAFAEGPVFYVCAEFENFAGDFAAESFGERDRDGEFALLGPEVETVEAARADADDNVVGAGNGIRNVAEFHDSGCAVFD
jgi:hypothetical protein